MQEIGCNWSNIPKKYAFQERLNQTFGRHETRSCLQHNIHDITGTRNQWGGTGVLCKGKIKFYAMGAGGDSTGLGRWSWARIRGKGGIILRYVSAYCPCENRLGTLAVWAQQRTYFQQNNDDRDPRQAFLEDLRTQLTTWIEDGDQVLLCGDLNHDVTSPTITSFFESMHMSNLLHERHDPQEAPSTYYLNSQGKSVDGIWGTPGLRATQGGYLRPEEFPGNHSLLWLDISYQSALGHNPPRPHFLQARRLQLHNEQSVKRYLSEYKKRIQAHKLPARQFYLESTTRWNVPLTPQQIQEYEAIDYLKTKCMKIAERKCRKLKVGKVSFSEATIVPLRHIAWWNIAIRRREGQTVNPKVWKRKKKEAGLEKLQTADMTLDAMRTKRREAVQAFRQAKKKHETHRVDHINKMPKKTRDHLLRVEHQRRLARAAKSVLGKLTDKSITKIEYEGQEYTTQASIEQILIAVNEAKTRASDHTPFMQGQLLHDFGYRQNTEAHERILQGTYNIPSTCHPATAALLTGLARPSTSKNRYGFTPRTHITTEDHIRGWKRQKEKTSGGMSGLHFGHYKAHLKDRTLAALDASMRSVAYTTGYSLRRWKKGLDVQLLKKSKDFRATNLRTILLLEPDHNMNNKAIGSDAMRMGERLMEHARDNYGGRRGLRAAEVSMNQVLTYNSIWARRGRAIIMSNDAKGCYDRIAHTVVNLALQRLGIPQPALQSMLATIQEMDHHIRTAFGDSEGSYGNDPTKPPPQGILQGSGAGQAGWASIVAVMIKKMRDRGFGYAVWTLIRQRALALVGFAFVDDTDLIHANHDRTVPTQQLLAEAQEALTFWEGLLHATGGALAPEKSYWYLVEVIRHNGVWTYARERQHPGDLFLDGATKNTRLEVYHARKSLGIMARPDGKMKDEMKQLQASTQQWCDGIRTKRLHSEEAWYSLTVTILRTLEYPLVATTFSQDQCKELMKPVLQTALPLCRIQRRLPRALVYGSYRTRGLNLPNLYWVQLIHHLQSILRHMHRDTPSRDMHEENMDLVQFHVGSTVTFWELPYEEYGVLAPDGWMKQTWHALSQTTITLKGPNLGLPNERIADVSLMDAFVAQGYNDKTLRTLNECRFWLAASHLSHISTACGTRIDQRCWDGKRHEADMRPRLIHTYKPTAKDWKLWQEKVRETFLYADVTHLRLKQALGPWLQPTSATWRWWKHQASQTLYEKQDNGGWLKWTKIPRQFDQDKFRTPTPIDKEWIPDNLRRASIHRPKQSPYVTVTSTGIATPPTIPEQAPTTLSARLQRLPPTASWALKHLNISDNGAHIAEAIKSHTAIAVSDGGLKLGLGTAAYVIEGRTSTGRIQGVNKVPGPIKEGDSHRCEVSGLYAVILLIKEICITHSISQGGITICCDNTTALQIFDPDYLPDPKHPSLDLVGACWRLKNTVPITWETEHIKGHQDRTQPIQNLSRKAKLNVAMDRTATAYWIHLATQGEQMATPETGEIYGEEWQLWNGDQKITHPTRKRLYPLMQDQVSDMWWTRERHISHEAHAIIDYDAVEDAMQHLSIPRRRYVTKTASENCGVGTTLVEWKYQPNAVCPRCPHQQETTQHVQQCQGYAAAATFNQSIDTLQAFLTKEATRPDLQDAIIHSIQKWRLRQPIHLRDYQEDIQQVIRQQHTIGWLDFMECLPAKGWQILQRQYYRTEEIQKSSRRWLRGLLLQLHHMGHKQWRHRCDIKNNITQPNDRAHIDLLHTEIEQQFELGATDLPVGDQPLLSHNILHLLDKSLAYKKGWLARIWAARQRAHRIAEHDNELVVQSKAASQVYQWCLHHQDKSSTRKRKRHLDGTMDEHTDNASTSDPKQRKGEGSEAETPVDTDPTDMQYIRDDEYCAHILAEQFPTTAVPAQGYKEQYATQPQPPQGDHIVVGIYDPDDGNPIGFTTPWQRPPL